jgi:hypothetical protein
MRTRLACIDLARAGRTRNMVLISDHDTVVHVGHVDFLHEGHPYHPHGDHVDYLVGARLHHPHGEHCDDHGVLELTAG